jgi:hypothetical protein
MEHGMSDSQVDWRAQNAIFLRGAKLQFRHYIRWSDDWDHDHCVGCWVKFAEFLGQDIQNEGYTTCEDYKHGAGYDWVCRQCFDELKDQLKWSLARMD